LVEVGQRIFLRETIMLALIPHLLASMEFRYVDVSRSIAISAYNVPQQSLYPENMLKLCLNLTLKHYPGPSIRHDWHMEVRWSVWSVFFTIKYFSLLANPEEVILLFCTCRQL